VVLYFEKIVLFQHHRFIDIAIKQCRSSGIDCKIHSLQLIGRLRSDDDDTAAAFSFLASDKEDEDDDRTITQTGRRKSKVTGGKDIQTHVFVWGLNDKDQLGGPKGSKVSV
jgi:E3 ubiquitin-protein ligase HERC2